MKHAEMGTWNGKCDDDDSLRLGSFILVATDDSERSPQGWFLGTRPGVAKVLHVYI